jgi:preprotein translocase SecF subunit
MSEDITVEEVVTEAAPDQETDPVAVLTSDLQRLQAEYANYKKRVERDRALSHELAIGSVLAEFLSVLDDIDRAESHGELSGGFKAVADQINTVTARIGLEKYGTEGESTWTVAQLDSVGRKVGSDFRRSAFLSLLYTCLLVTAYMYWRFDYRFVPGAIACIFHDLIIVAGFLVVTRGEFSTTVVAALLTLAGYSINDTVVVFDRIREIEHRLVGKSKVAIVNEAINSTLSRTIMTAGTTLVATMVLYFLGGPSLHEFSLALFVGIIVGTYSSAFIAAPLYIWADEKFAPKSATSQLAKT